jgi:hypoxanthine phosphoribosyltransferase
MALDSESLPDHPTPLLTQEAIAARVADLAAQIRADYASTRGLHMVCVLKGAFVFFSDLVRQLDRHATLDFIVVSSYHKATRSSGEVRLFRARRPKTLRTACLLSKPSRRQVDVPVDYIGFTIEDRFVIGYGLDYAERYRNLPYIGVLGE